MTGVERMKRMYEGNMDGVPVCLFFSTEYMCMHSGVPDYRFLYGSHESRAEAHIKMARRHDFDALYVWNRGKRNDWRADYQLVENGADVHIWDSKENRKLPLSEDYYAIDFPDTPPYRRPFIQYGESQEMINGVPTYSKPKLEIHSIEDVDRLLPLETDEQVKDGGMFDGVGMIHQEIGNDVFLEAACNSSFRFAVGVLGLQEGLMFMLEQPGVFRYLVERTMEQELAYLRVMASHGVHSAWINDIWVDLISESHYREFVMPITAAFIEEARKLGLKSHYYPLAKSGHLIPLVNELRPDALHLEEYAQMDICEIRAKLDPGVVLYGNIHALDVVQKGPISAIEDEAKRQIDGCLHGGPFVLAIGSEVTKHTPPEHVDALIAAAHSYKSS